MGSRLSEAPTSLAGTFTEVTAVWGSCTMSSFPPSLETGSELLLGYSCPHSPLSFINISPSKSVMFLFPGSPISWRSQTDAEPKTLLSVKNNNELLN